jgi:hypothetical protein
VRSLATGAARAARPPRFETEIDESGSHRVHASAAAIDDRRDTAQERVFHSLASGHAA